jgi:uncharacterized protein YndB with AHSA1/START domain
MPITMEVRASIDAPPERVFAAVSDPDALGKWMSGLVRIERLGGPATGKGARFREVRRMMGHEAGEVFEITAYDPPRSFELFCDGRQGSSKRGEFRFRYELEPRGGGTDLRVTGTVGGLGRFWEFLGRMFSGMLRRAVAKDLASLKAHVEGRQG